MQAQEIVRAKRDGRELSVAQIEGFVRGLVDGSWSDGQIAAFAMAVFFRGMSPGETAALTGALMHSGRVLRWPDLPGPVLDKHSSGGVGDKVSLILAPIVAACGGFVPMIAGRGLAHTGGTVDKLESIPGYNVTPATDVFERTVRRVGCAIIGQTLDLAPADQRLYAIRDVTATVDSIPLMTASILSKKFAEGVNGLVLDVTCGNGAFSTTLEAARAFAASIAVVAANARMETRVWITDMNQVRGAAAGNVLEIREALDYLTGLRRDGRLHEVTLALASALLQLGHLATDDAGARARLEAVLRTGAAAEKFAEMVAALGGPADLLDRPDAYLAAAPVVRAVPAPQSGVLSGMNTRAIGQLLVELGGGRRNAGDAIDHRVGLSEVLPLGVTVTTGQPLALLHAATEEDAARGIAAYRSACTLTDSPYVTSDVILDRL